MSTKSRPRPAAGPLARPARTPTSRASQAWPSRLPGSAKPAGRTGTALPSLCRDYCCHAPHSKPELPTDGRNTPSNKFWPTACRKFMRNTQLTFHIELSHSALRLGRNPYDPTRLPHRNPLAKSADHTASPTVAVNGCRPCSFWY